jgi:hypothetical protein
MTHAPSVPNAAAIPGLGWRSTAKEIQKLPNDPNLLSSRFPISRRAFSSASLDLHGGGELVSYNPKLSIYRLPEEKTTRRYRVTDNHLKDCSDPET